MKILETTVEPKEIVRESDGLKIKAVIVEKDGWEVQFEIEKAGKAGFVGEVDLGEFTASEEIFMNNYQSWGPCKTVNPAELTALSREIGVPIGFVTSPVPWEFQKGTVSDYFVFNEGIFAGFTSSLTVHPYFLWTGETVKIKAYVGKTMDNSEKFTFDLWIAESESLEATLDLYAKKVARTNEPKVGPPLLGWSSWYDYYLKVSQEALLEDLAVAADTGFELFQIDDGYEADVGDWLKANEKFPDGMEFMAKKVKEAGMIPGIWTAPFSVSETSETFKNHPDWLVRDEKGNLIVAYENWNKKIYALDATNPDALNWLDEIFSSLKEYGYGFFKIDFLFAGMIPGKRYLEKTPVEAYRMGMERIKKTLGNSGILGCGAPLLPTIGYVDSMRVGADTSPTWDAMDVGMPSAKYSVRNALTRHFMNGVWWTNDPDCIMARSDGTELSEDERAINAYLPAILNDHVLESDSLSRLSKEDARFFKKILNFRNGNSTVKFIDGERYIVISKGTVNGDLLTFVNLSDGSWEVDPRASGFFEEKEDTFFIRYPEMREIDGQTEVKGHSLFMVMVRGTRKMKKEDEKKADGRMFHYYGGDER